MVAAGETPKEVAAKLGISPQAVNKAVNNVLTYEQFDDIRNCRMIANRRLDGLRRHLLGLCGLVDDDEGGKPPPKNHQVEPKGHARIAAVLVSIEKRRAEMFGFDAPARIVVHEDPLENMSPEELLAHCIGLNIPVPPGLADEVARRQKAGDRPGESERGGTPPAG